MNIDSIVNTKQLIFLLVIVIIVLGGYYFLDNQMVEAPAHIPSHGEYRTLSIGNTELQVEIVGTNESKQRGLSNRESLSEDQGMFFLFEESDFHGIWMKDMLFPIDIIWLDENLTIITIIEDATPESFPKVFKSSQPSRYVLEVGSGTTQKLGIKIGEKISFKSTD